MEIKWPGQRNIIERHGIIIQFDKKKAVLDT